MKISRKQLRMLILNEVRIKPGIDDIYPDEHYAKILNLARSERPEYRNQADSLASTLGYNPSDDGEIYDVEEKELLTHQGQQNSFSDELRKYDETTFMNEVSYIENRLAAELRSFVIVYKSELVSKFGKTYSPVDLDKIMTQLGWGWELGHDDEDGNFFIYDQQ